MNTKRRTMLQLSCAAALAALPGRVLAAGQAGPMDVITALKTRRSVRAYTADPVSEADLKTILEAAMLAPSAANEQPWDFVVITDEETLAKAGSINHYASFARNAPLAILVCLNRDKEKEKGMGILDVAMSAENILLAAHGLGLGAVFTGIYPEEDRIKGFQELLNLPANVVPVGLIVIGHPNDPNVKSADGRYKEANIHREKW